MRRLLPEFLDLVMKRFQQTPASPETPNPVLIDLGCGTGRNTIQLLTALRTANRATQFSITGLDASQGMLEVARTAIRQYTADNTITSVPIPDVELAIFDLLQPDMLESQLPGSLRSARAAGVISTLVLEHIPLERFFGAAAMVMRSGAYLLVTNMHAEMGVRSQAGFTDGNGVKIRPTSYCHAIADVLAAAQDAGFEVEEVAGADEDGVVVRGVDEQLGDVLGARAKKWIGIKVWFGVCFVKKG